MKRGNKLKRFTAILILCLFLCTSLPICALAEGANIVEHQVKTKIEQVVNGIETNEKIADSQKDHKKTKKKESQPIMNTQQVSGGQNVIEQQEPNSLITNSLTANSQVSLMSTIDTSWYNTLVGPSAMNGVNEQKYSATANTQEIISPQTGDLTLKVNDINLPGRNGLDLNIGRIYQSSQNVFGNRKIKSDGTSYNDTSTYYLNRYDLGLGWAFNFPSIETEQENGRTELYYHTGSGDIYHVNWGATTSHLENYYNNDAVLSSNDSGFSNGQVTSQYSFTTADNTKRYFSSDGRLIGIKDRFNNTITFKHQNVQVTANNTQPLISEITDTIGRKITFQYNDKLYDDTFSKYDAGSIILTIKDPAQSSSYSITYNRFKYLYDFTYSNGTVEHRRYPGFDSCSNGDDYTSYQYLAGDATKEYYSFYYKTQNGYAGWSDRPMLTDIYRRNSKAHYDYEKVAKCLGTNGFYETHRITSRYEQYEADTGYTGNENLQTYSYSGTYNKDKFNNETGYPNYYFDNTTTYGELYTGTVTQQNGITTATTLQNSKEWKKVVTNPSSNEIITTVYDSYSSIYKNSVIAMHMDTTVPGKGTNTLYVDYTYNNWGGLATETKPLTADQRNNSTIKTKYTTTYTYDPTYKFLMTQNYYQDVNKTSLTETTNYDTQGRIQNTINAKGDTATYEYNDTGYPGNVTKMTVSNVNNNNDGKNSITTFDYSNAYHAFPTTVTKQYTEDGVQKNSSTQNSYEFIWGNIASTTDAGLHTTNYNYDPNTGRLSKVTYPSSTGKDGDYIVEDNYTYYKWSFVSACNNRFLFEVYNYRTKKPVGQTNTITISQNYSYYDDHGNLLRQELYDSDQGIWIPKTYTYNSYGQVSSVTDAKSHQTSYIFDGLNRIKAVIDANQNQQIYEYDDYSRTKTTYFSTSGTSVSTNFDASQSIPNGWSNKNLSGGANWSVINSSSAANPSCTAYSPSNIAIFNSASVAVGTQARLNTITGNGLNVTSGDTATVSFYMYHDSGCSSCNDRIQVQYSLDGGTTWLNADTTISRYNSTYTGWSYHSVTLPNVTGSNVLVGLLGISSCGNNIYVDNVTASSFKRENDYTETYDQWGRTLSRKGYPNGYNDPKVIQEQYQYDIVGNLSTLTDARGKNTTFHYNELNQLVNVTNAKGESTDYDYTKFGGLAHFKQYDGATTYTTTKLYDERGLLLSKQGPQENPTTYKYNAMGLPSQVTDASGKITTMEYDNNNRLQQISANQDHIKNYYNALGSIEKYEVTNDSTGAGENLNYDFYSTGLVKQRTQGNYGTKFEYDTVGNQTKVTDPFNLAVTYTPDALNRLNTVAVDGKTFTYNYYTDGMIQSVTYPTTGGGILKTEYTYDNINRMKTMTNTLGGNVISSFAYDYDDNGNITSVTENGDVTNYQYDDLNRLQIIDIPGVQHIEYTYDTRGNRKTLSDTKFNNQDVIPGTFGYNSWDEMSSFTSGMNSYEYKYDTTGLRTQKIGPNGTTRYHLDSSGRIVAESDGSDQVKAQIIWGNKALARKVDGQYYYYIYNGHGDVIQMISESGTIVNSYKYDEWGNTLFKQEVVQNDLKYCSEPFDDETGLYYLRARYYDPSIGRFISKDSVEGDVKNPLSLNLYTYCANDPIGLFDPSGCTVQSEIDDYCKNNKNVADTLSYFYSDDNGNVDKDAFNKAILKAIYGSRVTHILGGAFIKTQDFDQLNVPALRNGKLDDKIRIKLPEGCGAEAESVVLSYFLDDDINRAVAIAIETNGIANAISNMVFPEKTIQSMLDRNNVPIDAVYDKDGNGNVKIQNPQLSFDDVKSSINRGLPIIAGAASWSKSSGHYCVITGYSTENNTNYLYLNDVNRKINLKVSYDDFTNKMFWDLSISFQVK